MPASPEEFHRLLLAGEWAYAVVEQCGCLCFSERDGGKERAVRMRLTRMRTFGVPCPFSSLFVTPGAAPLQCNWSDSEAASHCMSPTDNASSSQELITIVRAGSPDIRILSFGCLF